MPGILAGNCARYVVGKLRDFDWLSQSDVTHFLLFDWLKCASFFVHFMTVTAI